MIINCNSERKNRMIYRDFQGKKLSALGANIQIKAVRNAGYALGETE